MSKFLLSLIFILFFFIVLLNLKSEGSILKPWSFCVIFQCSLSQQMVFDHVAEPDCTCCFLCREVRWQNNGSTIDSIVLAKVARGRCSGEIAKKCRLVVENP